MADYTQTITNEIYTYGPEPSKFGIAVFGTDTFGDDLNDLDVNVGKLLTETILFSSIIIKRLTKFFSFGSLSVDDDNDVTYAEYVGDGSGWYYQFPSETRNAENRALTQWTEV